jgi:hypothetical protein
VFGACLEDAATRRKLDDDIGWASTFDPEGTPIVLVNGRLGTAFGPFLYAMVLARGDAGHPAFRAVPPPRRAALVP